MGRNKKYQTVEELKEARKRWNKTYYEKNKTELNRKTMEKYYELQKKLPPIIGS